MKTILATFVSMFLFVSFSNAATSCADLLKDYDAKIKTAKLEKAVADKAAALRKTAGDQLTAKKEADCVKSANEAFKVAGLKPAAEKKAEPAKK